MDQLITFTLQKDVTPPTDGEQTLDLPLVSVLSAAVIFLSRRSVLPAVLFGRCRPDPRRDESMCWVSLRV